jgi:mono/diheme cytochrome c family protein
MRRWPVPVAVLSILCLALVLPALGKESEKDGATPDTTPAGQQVFVAQKCQMCHTVYSAGIGEAPAEDAKKKDEKAEGPPDLSLAGTGRTAEWISLFLQKKEALNEKKHMLKFKGDDEELAALANWILTLKAPEVEAAPATTSKVEKAAEPAVPAEPEARAESEIRAEPEAPAADAEKDE